MIANYNEFLLERKQRGEIYHYTSLAGLIAILDSNMIRSKGDRPRVSLTRDKYFHRVQRYGVKTDVRFTLDGDMLTDVYKIRPFSDFKDAKYNMLNYGVLSYGAAMGYLPEIESEEVTNKPITDVSKYVLKIELVKERIDEFTVKAFWADNKDIVEEMGGYLMDKLHTNYYGEEEIVRVFDPAFADRYKVWIEEKYKIQIGFTEPVKIIRT